MQIAFPNDFSVNSDLSGGYKRYPALNIRVNHSMLMTYLSHPQEFAQSRPKGSLLSLPMERQRDP